VAKTRDARWADRLPGFSDRVRELRARAGLTQDQLAERAGLSVTMVQGIERASDGGNPRLTTLWALAAALGVDAADLLAPTGSATGRTPD
jgi:transcriptional regulator with XRE-family HTH domain